MRLTGSLIPIEEEDLLGEPEARSLGRARHRLQNNIKMDFR
jgi:hypothetical protein